MAWVCNGVEFKVGDTVRVVREEQTGAPNGMGEGVKWENCWSGFDGNTELGMDKWLGRKGTIEDISVEGVTFEMPDDELSYSFPLTSLEKVNK
jgi:hypothetical protein